MCDECGCDLDKKVDSIEIDKSVSSANNAIASEVLNFLKDKGILCVNIMGSPGSGKTTFIENISKFIPTEDLAVIQGDLESDIDTQRLKSANIYSYQINTHSGCHLNAAMINRALHEMNLSGKKYLLIENVGNLVCPADISIGQHTNIVISSVAEGSDKPRKYPIIFLNSKMVVISKSDLKDAVGFDEKSYITDLTKISPKTKIVQTSSKNQESFRQAAHFIEHARSHLINEHHNH